MSRPPLSTFHTKPPLSNFQQQPAQTGNFASEFGAGLVSQAPQTAANLGGFMLDALGQVPGSPLRLADDLQKGIQRGINPSAEPQSVAQRAISGGGEAKNWLAQKFGEAGVDTETLAGSLGGLTTELAGTFTGAGAGTKLAQRIIGGVEGKLGRAADIALKSAASTQGAKASLSGDSINPAEAGVGLGIDIVAGGAGKVADKLGNFFFRRLAQSTPTQLAKDTAKNIDLGQVLAKETGVSFSKEQVVNKLTQNIKAASSELDSMIKAADAGDTSTVVRIGQKIGFTADDLFPAGSIDDILKNRKLQLKFGDINSVKKQITSTLSEFKKTLGDQALSLSEVQNLKKQLGSSLSGFYAKTGDAKAAAKELVNDIIRKNAKLIVESNVAGAKEINKRLSGLITAEKRLKSKGVYSGYLTDILAGTAWSGAQGMAGQNDAGSYLKNLALGIIGKRIGTSTLAKSLAGQASKKAADLPPIISILAKQLFLK
jgi:hypothetical protein